MNTTRVRTNKGREMVVDKDRLAEWYTTKLAEADGGTGWRLDLDVLAEMAGSPLPQSQVAPETWYIPSDTPVRVLPETVYDGAGGYGTTLGCEGGYTQVRMDYDGAAHWYPRDVLQIVSLVSYQEFQIRRPGATRLNVPYTPAVGMGATVRVGSDSYAYTVIRVSAGGKRAVLQQDEAICVRGGYTEDDDYLYLRNAQGARLSVFFAANGAWKLKGGAPGVTIGHRRQHRDPHF